MAETEVKIDVHRGLQASISTARASASSTGRRASSSIVGIRSTTWPEHSTFEETCYLLLQGELPARAELEAFDAELKAEGACPGRSSTSSRTVKGAHPMDVLRTAVSALAAFDRDVADNSPGATLRRAYGSPSQVPMLVAAHERHSQWPRASRPDPSFGHAANFLWMLKGTAPAPMPRNCSIPISSCTPSMARMRRRSRRASSIGTEANIHAAITAAIAALSGPAHGGAAEE